MSLHYLNGILTQNEIIQKINKNAFKNGIEQMRQPEFKTPYTMNSYDVNDILFYPEKTKNKKAVVNGWFEDAIQNVTSTIQTATTNVQQTLSTGVQNVLTTTQQAINTIQSQGATALQNVTSTIQNALQGLPLTQNFVDRFNTFYGKMTSLVGTYGKKIAMQPMRTAFILAVSTNALNLASMLAQGWLKDKNKITNWYVNDFGGDINVLKTAISRGSKTSINGDVNPEEIVKAISACSMIITSVIGVLKQLGINIGQKDKENLAKIQPNDTPVSVGPTSPQIETLPTFSTETETKNNTLLYVSVGGAVLLGSYLLMKKRK
jgi:hypothetical protein